MKLRSGRIISEPKPSVVMKPDVIMIDLTIDEIPKSADPNAPYTFKNPRPQEFSLPYPLVKYITMKATSFKAWRKLISTCKYFYARNPVIPIRDCQKSKYNDYEWSLSWTFGKYKLIDLRNISCKFWLHGHLYSDETTSHSFLAPKVFRYDPNSLTLHSQIILYDEYQRLTSGKMIEYLYFCDVNVIYPDGSPVALDKLLKNLSNAKKITLLLTNLYFAPDTVGKMNKMLSDFNNSSFFRLSLIPKTFNLAQFKKIVQKHHTMYFLLEFEQPDSDAYKTKIKKLFRQCNNVSVSFR